MAALAPSIGITLAIAVPTLVVEEDWHGHPMIDQHNLLWVIPALVVALAFFLGGYHGGRHASSQSVLAVGAGVGGAAAGFLVLAAYIRRSWILGDTWWAGVIRLWIVATTIAIVIAIAGAGFGRRSAVRSAIAEPASRVGP